ncbi:MAG: hypothetical protein ACEQSA_05915, partial [Weeksellaceae bacterium]
FTYGSPSSVDLHHHAVNYLATIMAKYPNIAFPKWKYSHDCRAANVNSKTVGKRLTELINQCEHRIANPGGYILPPPPVHYTIPTGGPLIPIPFPTSQAKPVIEKTYNDIVFPVTPMNEIFKSPTPVKQVHFKLMEEPLTPIQPQEDKDVPYEVTIEDFIYFKNCNCLLHDVTFEEFQKEWPCVRDENKVSSGFFTFERNLMRDHFLKKREPECVSPIEEADPSPIRINLNERDQMAMIEPPCGWQGDFFGPLSYPWIFGGFTLAHLICEMDAGFPFIGRCSDQTLRKILLDLQGIYELFTTLMSLPVGPDLEGIDTDWTYSSVLCNVSLSEFDDGIGGIGAQGSIFNKCKRRILTKVVIDLDELISAFRLLLTKSSMVRLTHVGFTNEEIREHIHRVQSYQL